MNDWRIRCQQDYLSNRTFIFTSIVTDDHEHCEFCFDKFSREREKKGYLTLDGYYVVCDKCYEDFKRVFRFKLFNENDFAGEKISDIIFREVTSIVDNENIYLLSSIETLIENLHDVRLYSEKFSITPCYAIINFGEKVKFEFLNQKVNFEANEIYHFEKKIKCLKQLSANVKQSSNIRLCVKIDVID